MAIARFDGSATELSFESIVSLEHSPADASDLALTEAARSFPVGYSAEEMPDLAHCIERHHADPDDEVGRWARQFLHASGSIGTLELLVRLSQGIHQGFLYRRREAKGIQQPLETLRLGHGSCRDFALLMIEAARSLGLAARFVSGYLAVPLAHDEEPAGDGAVNPAHGATHAWAQVYLPGAGWIDFDPTSGSVGKAGSGHRRGRPRSRPGASAARHLHRIRLRSAGHGCACERYLGPAPQLGGRPSSGKLG